MLQAIAPSKYCLRISLFSALNRAQDCNSFLNLNILNVWTISGVKAGVLPNVISLATTVYPALSSVVFLVSVATITSSSSSGSRFYSMKSGSGVFNPLETAL